MATRPRESSIFRRNSLNLGRRQRGLNSINEHRDGDGEDANEQEEDEAEDDAEEEEEEEEEKEEEENVDEGSSSTAHKGPAPGRLTYIIQQSTMGVTENPGAYFGPKAPMEAPPISLAASPTPGDEDRNKGRRDSGEGDGDEEKKENDDEDEKRREMQRKPSLRMKSVRRASFDAVVTEDADMQSDDEDGGGSGEEEEEEEDQEGGEEEDPVPRRRSVTSESAAMYRRNSYREAIETFKLADVYQETKAKQLNEWGGKAERSAIARLRWLNAMHTVLRGVRAVNAFMPSAYRKRRVEEKKAQGKKGGAWHAVKKTAVQQAVQNRMAMEFKVGEEQSGVKTIGFAFGKSADSQLFENCLNILKTEHKKRSRPDVVMLLSLLKGNAFFSKLDYEVKLELASIMGLQSVKEGNNVFKQGDVGNLFYIVLNGEVDVFVTHMGIQFKACTYNVGGSFGERALLTSEPRAATVTCVTDSDFLVIGRRDYLRVLRDVHERESTAKISFLKTVRYFDALPGVTCEELAQKFVKKRYGRNEVIIKEGDKHSHLFIIRNGECRVLKKVDFGGVMGEKFLETRHLSSRDFFGQEDDSLNPYSVLSTSFAEVYAIHVNDLKNFTDEALKTLLVELRTFVKTFERYNDEEYLVEQFKLQRGWEEQKRVMMQDVKRESIGRKQRQTHRRTASHVKQI